MFFYFLPHAQLEVSRNTVQQLASLFGSLGMKAEAFDILKEVF